MSENIELARTIFPGPFDIVVGFTDPEGWKATRPALEPLVHPDFETVTAPGQVPLSGVGSEDSSRPVFHGLDGFVTAFSDWLSAWESWVVTATDFIEVDEDRVLVMLDVRARSKTHQVEMPFEGANLLTMRAGKLARLELFFDRVQAREAAGLSEIPPG